MPLKFLNLLLFFLLLHHHHHHQTSADVGTAAYYGPPYLHNIFAAAGDGIWDNGACCGRQYLVRCLSSSPESCIADQTIRVEVINQASMLDSNPSLNGTTMTLSDAAFLQIANKSSPVINIEFTQI
ncbi:EG45-like domain containing protein isoform X3 [Dioscorea cayenensis subsp. rotundata]|uniref:EG45-like domain containing protein isoform X3 n=1 Tax=Dioscorea cayennensis subsp. rotundata TaxID=55577 RepID=A0AB40BHZ7_DIOCR|nr:EG45-like domain containing protein isoform X3 [Dioscorea cayenensis subsp. rotundata]